MRQKHLIILFFGASILFPFHLAIPVQDVIEERVCPPVECSGDSKFHYIERKTYVYSFEASNILEINSEKELFTSLECTVEITRLSMCEMVLRITEAAVKHDGIDVSPTKLSYLEEFPLHFSFIDGSIPFICPDPRSTEQTKNIQKAILSTFQNSMKTLIHDSSIIKETDILGNCETHYIFTGIDNGGKITIQKTKNIASCTDHVTGKSGFTFDPYESSGSIFEHLPIMSNESFACHYVVNDGVTHEVFCAESASFGPFPNMGYAIRANGEVKLQYRFTKEDSSERATHSLKGNAHLKTEKLTFIYKPEVKKNTLEDAERLIQLLCDKSNDLLENDVGLLINQLIDNVRYLEEESIQAIYDSLERKILCKKSKVKNIFLDSLKAAASGGALKILAKLSLSNKISKVETFLWLTTIPFVSDPDEKAIEAVVPLMEKKYDIKQAVLSVPGMAYKFCKNHEKCETKSCIKSILLNLDSYIEENCEISSTEKEEEIIHSLKGFGNLGYIETLKDSIFNCVAKTTNSIPVRIAALEAFRRTPCSDVISNKILKIFENMDDHDEVRISAAITLSQCPSPAIIERMAKTYDNEKSKQVEVFTWSYLKSLQDTSDPLKRKAKYAAQNIFLKKPYSTDMFKFSRHISKSVFIERLNIGFEANSNLIHSRDSFLPRSANLVLKLNIFGFNLNLFEVGSRAENFEKELERLLFSRDHVHTIGEMLSENNKSSSANAYREKIRGIKDKVNMKKKGSPHGVYYFRIMGNELQWNNISDAQTMKTFFNFFDAVPVWRKFTFEKEYDIGHTLMFLDNTVLLPSLTGRAYKFDSDGSATFTVTSSKVKLDKNEETKFHFAVDAKKSIAIAVSASLSIFSDESYHPAILIHTTTTGGLVWQAKIDIRKGHGVEMMFGIPKEKIDLLHMKRDVFIIDKNGATPLHTHKKRTFAYCTKYLEKMTGLKFCGDINVPVLNNKAKNFMLMPMDASFRLSIEDGSMKGFKFSLHYKENKIKRELRIFLGLESKNGKMILAEYLFETPDSTTKNAYLKFVTPIFNFDANVESVSNEEKLEMKAYLFGNKIRKCAIDLYVERDVKGARLTAYKPTLKITMGKRNPIKFSGSIVFARGRKEQISLDIGSDSFENDFLVKGNIAKEGVPFFVSEKEVRDSEFELITDLNIHAAAIKQRLQGTYKRVGHHINLDINLDYQTIGRSVKNIKIRSSFMGNKFLIENYHVDFHIENEFLLSEHPDFNNKIIFDFSFKPGELLKSDMSIRYGNDFSDNSKSIESKFESILEGSVFSFKEVNFDNKFEIKIPCVHFDKGFFITIFYDFTEKPKFKSEIGMKLDLDKYIKNEVNFESFNGFNMRPIKLTVETKLTLYENIFLFRDEIKETSPNIIHGRAVFRPFTAREITVDYVYMIKSNESMFLHELESTIVIPGFNIPIEQKFKIKKNEKLFEISSHTDTGERSKGIYKFEMRLKEDGSEVITNSPYAKGNLKFLHEFEKTNFQADIVTFGDANEEKHIKGTGELMFGNEIMINVEIYLDTRKKENSHSEEKGRHTHKIILSGRARKGEKDEGRIISASLNYADFIEVVVSGKLGKHFLFGPHDLKADFSGNIEPMTISIEHKINNQHMESNLRYLRSNVEKLRVDLSGKFIYRYVHVEIEGGLLLTSPYKTFDAKEIFLGLFLDSNEINRVLTVEYRLKSGALTGYTGKADYRRKLGFPGFIKSITTISAHRKIITEISAGLEYGGGKYSLKASVIPTPSRKLNFISSFDITSRYAAFRHNFQTTMKYFHLISMNAIADFRNSSDLKMESNFDINSYKIYDLNASLISRSIADFEGSVNLIGNLVPSLCLSTKTHNTNSATTKFTLNIKKGLNDISILTGRGEIKKRKKSFTSEIIFSYREKDFLTLTINNEVKSKVNSYYLKLKSVIRMYTIRISTLKDKETLKILLCRNEDENCIHVESMYKRGENVYEWQLNYKRATIDLTLNRMIADTSSSYHRLITIGSGNRKFGYEVKYVFTEKNKRNAYFAVYVPTRKISMESTIAVSTKRNYSAKFEILADATKRPDRKLIIEIESDMNFLSSASKRIEITVSHPIFEKPIDINVVTNYDKDKALFLDGALSIDYSADPEDNLLTKMYFEKVTDGEYNINSYFYHKDYNNLDFELKTEVTFNDAYSLIGMHWIWTNNDKEEKANLLVKYSRKEKEFNFSINYPPKLDFRLDVAAKPYESFHEDVLKLDVNMIFNEKLTKALLFHDIERSCRKLIIIGDDGTTSCREAELCINVLRPVMISMTLMSRDDDGFFVFDYSYELIRSKLGKINVRNHYNPEFLGGLIFKYNQLADELNDAGFYSERFKTVLIAFKRKILNPLRIFFTDEINKIHNETDETVQLVENLLLQYYDTLPSYGYIKRFLKTFKKPFDEIINGVNEYLQEVKHEIQRLLKLFLAAAKETLEKLKTRCETSVKECDLLMEALMKNGGSEKIMEALKTAFNRLSPPESIRGLIEKSGEFGRSLRKKIINYIEIVRSHTHLLFESSFMLDVKEFFSDIYDNMKEKYVEYVTEAVQFAIQKRNQLIQNENLKKIRSFFSREYSVVLNDVFTFDYVEEYMKYKFMIKENMKAYFHTPKFFDIKNFDIEKGVIDIDFYFVPILFIDLPHEIFSIVSKMYKHTSFFSSETYSLKTALIKLKRIMDYNNVLPPYKETAMIIGKVHYITWDKTFYDFHGECAYLLASDLEDGNFSLVITPSFALSVDEKTGERAGISFGVLSKHSDLLINLEDKTIKSGDKTVDLPYETEDIAIKREKNEIIIEDRHGNQIKCHTHHEICVATIPGTYYGKTAGLFGTYNYEPSDDFKRPKGQIPNSITTFAKSYDISKACKTKNLVREIKLDTNSINYDVCKEVFGNSSSPLNACFSEVNPEEYLALCFRHLESHMPTDKDKALCTVAVAYVMECEKNYVDLNLLPSKCLSCDGPTGSKMVYGSRKEFINFTPSSSDIIFVIEASFCNNMLVKYIDNLVRSIDKELKNERLTDNLYGVVVFKNVEGGTRIFTSEGKVLFRVEDVEKVVRRVKLFLQTPKSKKSAALEALNLALKYPFRSGAAKSLILLGCSPCAYDFKSLHYPILEEIMLKHEITLHVISDQEIRLRKSSKEMIIGVDADTVYHVKDVTQKNLTGEPSLRPFVNVPKDSCIALAEDVDGSFFSSKFLEKELNAWQKIFSRRVVKSANVSPCQLCDCTSTSDHMAKTICEPCAIKEPRIPFSVCKSCKFRTPLTPFYSYIINMVL